MNNNKKTLIVIGCLIVVLFIMFCVGFVINRNNASIKKLYFNKTSEQEFDISTNETEYYYKCKYNDACIAKYFYKNYVVLEDGKETTKIYNITDKKVIKEYANSDNVDIDMINNYVIADTTNREISIYNLDTDKESFIPGIRHTVYPDYNGNDGILVKSGEQDTYACSVNPETSCEIVGFYNLKLEKWAIKLAKEHTIYMVYNQFDCNEAKQIQANGSYFIVLEKFDTINTYALNGELLSLKQHMLCFNDKYTYSSYEDKQEEKHYLLFDKEGKLIYKVPILSYVTSKTIKTDNNDYIAYSPNRNDYYIINASNGVLKKFEERLYIINLFDKVYLENSKNGNNYYVRINDYNDKVLYTFTENERFKVDSFKESKFGSDGDYIFIYDVYDYQNEKIVTISLNTKTKEINYSCEDTVE